MKILFVAPWIPGPQRPRSLRFLEILHQHHDVHFIGLSDRPWNRVDSIPARKVRVIDEPPAKPLLRATASLLLGGSLQEGYANSPLLHDAVHKEVLDWAPDVVHLNVFRSVSLLEKLGQPIVFDLDEFRSEYYKQLRDTGSSVAWRTIGRVEFPRMKRREKDIVERSRSVLVSGPEDVRVMGGWYPQVRLVPSICEPTDRIGGVVDVTAPRVLFVGRLSYEANMSGLSWFLENCWESLKSRFPAAEVDVVGADPPRSLRSDSAMGVNVHGEVSSVAGFYASATVTLTPITRGTGVQMKLIQSLCAGVPAVASTDAVRRAGLTHGQNVMSADSAEDWIAAVSQLLDQPSLRAKLAAEGKEWAIRNHSRKAVETKLLAAYSDIAVPDP